MEDEDIMLRMNIIPDDYPFGKSALCMIAWVDLGNFVISLGSRDTGRRHTIRSCFASRPAFSQRTWGKSIANGVNE